MWVVKYSAVHFHAMVSLESIEMGDRKIFFQRILISDTIELGHNGYGSIFYISQILICQVSNRMCAILMSKVCEKGRF